MQLKPIYNNDKLSALTFNALITSKAELNQTNQVMDELDSSISLFFLWATIFSIIILALVKILYKLERSKMQGLSILSHAQIPCRKCIFFDKNEYLKCAVNPNAVFTKQAIDCSDYHSRNEDCAANDTKDLVKTSLYRDEQRNYF